MSRWVKMKHRFFFALLLAVSVTACAESGPPVLSDPEAISLIKDEFPQAEIRVTGVRMDEGGRAVAPSTLNGMTVDFIFELVDEEWSLELIDFEGSVYAIGDLEQISQTMVLMGEIASALAQYKTVTDAYPLGEGNELLQALVPDYLAEGTAFGDAWQRDLTYTSDGDDYTLISWGPDAESGSRDDIVLHSGEFVGAQRRQGP